MMTDAQAVEILKAFDPSEPRDDHGRWTVAGAQAEHAASDAMRAAGVRDYHPEAGGIRGTFRALATAAQAKASALAASIKHFVSSTRLVGASPLDNGGVEMRFQHRTKGNANVGPTTINSYVQLHPSHIASKPQLQRALTAVHGALVATGYKPAPVRHPPVAATFSRE